MTDESSASHPRHPHELHIIIRQFFEQHPEPSHEEIPGLLRTVLVALDEVLQDQHALSAKLDDLSGKADRTMANLQDLQAAVDREGSVVASAVTLLTTISDELKAAQAAQDPAAIQAVIDHLDANTQPLADAVAANTPAAPVAPAAPVDTPVAPADVAPVDPAVHTPVDTTGV